MKRPHFVVSLAQVARHRERAGKIQHPAVQGWGSEQAVQGEQVSDIRRSRFRAHNMNPRTLLKIVGGSQLMSQ